ncbi:MAG TPA: ATP-binding protein, partial [Thermoanaerobaculia bacterium]|nr:ATP-binding protein [Thermoanaerobaculia bacterium]
NDGYIPVLGGKHPQALGQRGDECWAEIWDVVGPLYEQVIRTGEATFSEDLLLLMERSHYLEETYFTFSYSPVRDEQGDVAGNLITCTETTGRVVGERRLRTLRDLGARAAEGKLAADACAIAAATLAANPWDVPFTLIYLLDGEGRRLRLTGSTGVPAGSDAAPDIVELDATDTGRGWPLAEVLLGSGPVRVKQLAERFDRVPPGPWPDPPQTALALPLAAPGQELPTGVLVAGVNPRRALDEGYLSFFALVAGQIATAITNARAYQEERRRAEALAELDRAKTAFFNNVSHEFRTPLTLLLGPLEDALEEGASPLSGQHRERIEAAHRNALRLLKLVNTLLDFARIEVGRIEAMYEPTDLAAYTADLASVFRSAVERAGLRLAVDCPPLGEPVYVDREMWEKIVLNLLSNAFKFTLDGEITVRLREVGDRVALSVTDTGVGIPAADLPQVFERFRRVRMPRARSMEGSGIGLALVSELVKLHGGQVAVESTPGQGSTFTVAIPRGSAHLPAERIGGGRTLASTSLGAAPYVEEALRWLPPSAPASLEAPAGAPPPLSSSTARILLADDNADMRDYVRRLLGERWAVEAVDDGAAALAAALAAPPDLILADVMMPELDGFELLRELRADPRTRSLPVILLSARAGEESRIEGLEAGADDYLVKPFSARELIARVGAQLAAARVREEAGRERDELLAREREARREAEAASRAKDEFLAMLSHELRNPLGAISNAAHALEDAAGADAYLQRLGRIVVRQSRHLSRLLDDLLDVARVTAGKIELRSQTVDLAEVAERCVRTLQDSGRSQRHLLEHETSPAWVEGDPARLEQVLINLLENAVKYTPDGGTVRLTVGPEGDDAVARIRDTGIGIEPGMLSRVFDLFVQGEQPLARTGGGLGLGLTLVRRLVEMHGGGVEARSDGAGRGSEFSVRLPLRAPAAAAQPGPALAAAGSARRVLIVEDNADSREALRLLLELDGHQVAAAEDGPQALELAASFVPDLVLLDIGLPGMDGYEVARSLGRHPERSRMRLVALSGYGQESDVGRSRDAGIDLHLVKPVDPGRLRELLAGFGAAPM